MKRVILIGLIIFCVELFTLYISGRNESALAFDGYGACAGPQSKAQTDNANFMPQVYDYLEKAGVKWVRIGFKWSEIETSDQQFSFDKYDALVNSAREHNLKILGLVHSTPNWANGNQGTTKPPTDINQWKTFVRTLVSRYKDKIKYWEIWNEVDANEFWTGTPVQYVDLLKVAYEEIGTVSTEIKVLSAGLDGSAEKENLTNSAKSYYLRQLLDVEMASYCDIIAFHPYGKDVNTSIQRVKNFLTIMEEKGVKKPLWITEVGWQTGTEGPSKVTSEQIKADYLKEAFERLKPFAEVIFWYRAQDKPAGFGLLEVDSLTLGLTKKQAYTAYKENAIPSLLKRFQEYPLRGIWGGLAGGVFGEHTEDIINNETRLDEAIKNIYQKYNFNTAFISWKYLTDDNDENQNGITDEISLAGKRLLIKTEAAGIKVIISFNRQLEVLDEAQFLEHKTGVGTFIKSVYDFRATNLSAYNNILAYFIGDDIGDQRWERTQILARFIKNEVYNNDKDGIYVIEDSLDIPLMIDVAGINAAAAGKLKDDVEIIGAYEYPFLRKDFSHNKTLDDFKSRLNGAGIDNDINNRFFTVLQAHTQDWYNAIFHNTDDYNLSLPVNPEIDAFPEGIQSASLVYQSLRSNVRQYLYYTYPYFNSDVNNFAQDRLAEIGPVNKLVDILWEPILKNGALNYNIERLFDTTNMFEGNVLNFGDSNGEQGALLIINSNKSNNIFGKASGGNVIFESYAKDGLNYLLSFSALGMIKKSDLSTLKIKQVDFPQVRDVSCSITNDNIKITASSINENTFVLITYDDSITTVIDNALRRYSYLAKDNPAKSLATEALNVRFNKTKKEFDEIEAAGYSIPAGYWTTLNGIEAQVTDCSSLTYRDIRSVISSIGDLQVEVYNNILNINNPDNSYRVNNQLVYPDGDKYINVYWNPPKYGYVDYKGLIIPKLSTCEPQKFHFYVLDRYVRDYIISKFTYIYDISATSLTNNSVSIQCKTNQPVTCQVEYGTTTNYGSIKNLSTSLTTSHAVTLEGLAWKTKYHYRIIGKDAKNFPLKSKNYTIIPDATSPTIPVVTDEGQFTNKKDQLYASWTASSDSDSGIVEYKYAIGTSKGGTDTVTWASAGKNTQVTIQGLSLTEGKTYHVSAKAINGGGKESIGYSDGIIVDTTPPQTLDSGIDGLWHKAPVTVTLNASDLLSGIDKTYYSTNATGPDIIYTVYSGSVTLSVDGIYTIKYYSSDNAGNSEAVKTALTQVMIDTILPTGNILIKGGANFTNSVSVVLNLSAADAGSGISQMKFSNDNSTWTSWENYATSKNWTVLLGDGIKTVYVKFKDNTGNISSAYSDNITLDTTAPAGLISVNNGASYTSSAAVTLNLSATDAGSGVAQMKFSNDNITYSSAEAYAQTKSWTLTSGNGTKTVYAKFKDAAGNWSGAYSDTIILDTTPAAPSNLAATIASATQINLTWLDNSTNETGFKIERKLGAGGTYAQIATIGANVISYSNTGLTEGTNYYYRVRAYNAAGNSSYSNETNATTKLKVPTALTAIALTGRKIKLTWADTSSSETGYEIERKTGSSGTYSKIATLGVNATTYTNSGLTANTTYYYRIRAYKTGGIYSSYTSAVSATAKN